MWLPRHARLLWGAHEQGEKKRKDEMEVRKCGRTPARNEGNGKRKYLTTEGGERRKTTRKRSIRPSDAGKLQTHPCHTHSASRMGNVNR